MLLLNRHSLLDLNFSNELIYKLFCCFVVEGKGPLHFGVASNYLYDLNVGDDIHMFVRRYCKKNNNGARKFSN